MVVLRGAGAGQLASNEEGGRRKRRTSLNRQILAASEAKAAPLACPRCGDTSLAQSLLSSPGGSPPRTAADLDDGENDCENFAAIARSLRALRAVWAANKATLLHQNDRLAPVVRELARMVDDEEHAVDEKGRLAEVEKLKRTIIDACAAVEEDADAFIDPRLPQMPTGQAIDALRKGRERVEELRVARAADAARLRRRRAELIDELGGSEHGVPGAAGGDEHGLSESSQRLLRRDIAELESQLRGRRAELGEIADEIQQLLRRRKGIAPPDASRDEVDDLVAQYTRCKKARVLGVGPGAAAELLRRRDELRREREEHEEQLRGIQRKLRLIEDRQALLDLIRSVEDSAADPLRLFGMSGRLVSEAQFRRMAYPRLLLLERALRPVLLEFSRRNGGDPFRYKGEDYLARMDEDLRTRNIQRSLFPPPQDMDPSWTDFEYVVETGGAGSGHRASLEDLRAGWNAGSPRTRQERIHDEEDRRLLRLGWIPARAVAAAAAAGGRGRRVSRRVLVAPPVVLPKPPRGAARESPPPPRAEAFPSPPQSPGTSIFHAPAPQLFKQDPNLLLPSPPSLRQRRVRVNREQLHRIAAPVRDDTLRQQQEQQRQQRDDDERRLRDHVVRARADRAQRVRDRASPRRQPRAATARTRRASPPRGSPRGAGAAAGPPPPPEADAPPEGAAAADVAAEAAVAPPMTEAERAERAEQRRRLLSVLDEAEGLQHAQREQEERIEAEQRAEEGCGAG